jgi:hypothetical protein
MLQSKVENVQVEVIDSYSSAPDCDTVSIRALDEQNSFISIPSAVVFHAVTATSMRTSSVGTNQLRIPQQPRQQERSESPIL